MARGLVGPRAYRSAFTMFYALRDGVTFCETGGRFLFLDVPRDRYFCLGQRLEVAFRDFLNVDEEIDRRRAPAILIEQGLLIPAEEKAEIRPAPAPAEVSGSILDEISGAASGMRLVFMAATALQSARRSLRRRGLASTLDKLAALRRAPVRQPGGEQRLAKTVAAFEQINLLFSPLDQCLPRSIALAETLWQAGVEAKFVIGVRARPFLAHSWVQCGPIAANERVDIVRTFTPILVI